MLIEQTKKKSEETLDFKFVKSRETFHFIPPISIEGPWMIGLTNLEVYNSLFNIKKGNNKFEPYTVDFNEFSLEESKEELEEIHSVSDITPQHLQHEKIGPRNFQA